MYRNYDGNRSTFGDTSVAAATANPDSVAAFAAHRSSDGARTVMVINKSPTASAAATIALANFMHRGVAQAWQLTSANPITRLADLSFGGTSFAVMLPAQSMTLFVIPPQPPNAPANLRVVRVE